MAADPHLLATLAKGGLHPGPAQESPPEGDGADDVYQQLLPDFPSTSIDWVKDVPWKGPQTVPLKSIDTDNRKAWAATHEPKKVKLHQKLIAEGKSKPIVLGKIPGNPKFVILDAHHRFLAYEANGEDPQAFVGVIPPKYAEHALTMHSSQYSGGSKLNGTGGEDNNKGQPVTPQDPAEDQNIMTSDLKPETIAMMQKAGLLKPAASKIDLQEPGGPSHWTIREQPDFLMMTNERTGKRGKVKMENLTPEEEEQANAPHGADQVQHEADATLGDVMQDDSNRKTVSDIGSVISAGGQSMQQGYPQAATGQGANLSPNTNQDAIQAMFKPQIAAMPTQQIPMAAPPPQPMMVHDLKPANGIAPATLAQLQSLGWAGGAPAPAPAAPANVTPSGGDAPLPPPDAPPPTTVDASGSSDLSGLTQQQKDVIGGVSPPAPPKPGMTDAARWASAPVEKGPGTQVAYAGATPPAGPAGPGAPLLPPGPAGGGAQAAKWVPTTKSTETKTTELRDEDKAKLAADREKLQGGQTTEEQQKQLELTQAPLIEKAKALETAIAQQKQADIEEKRQKAQSEAQAEEKWKLDKANAASDLRRQQGVDPSHMWKNKSLIGKFGTVFSLIVGGLAGSDTALKNFRADRDQDIALQQKDIEGKDAAARDEDTHYNQFIKQGMDKDQAVAAAKVSANKQFADMLNAKYSTEYNTMGKMQLAKMMQEHAAASTKDDLEYAKVTAPVVTKKADMKFQQAIAAGAGQAVTRKQIQDTASKWVSEGKYTDIDQAMRAAGHLYGYDPKGAAPVEGAYRKPTAAGKVNPLAAVGGAILPPGASPKVPSTLGSHVIGWNTSPELRSAQENADVSQIQSAANLYAKSMNRRLSPGAKGEAEARALLFGNEHPDQNEVDNGLKRYQGVIGSLQGAATPGAADQGEADTGA